MNARLACTIRVAPVWIGRNGQSIDADSFAAGGVRLSYGMPEWANFGGSDQSSHLPSRVERLSGAFRSLAVFNAPAETILLAEQGLNFNQIVIFPINQDSNLVGNYSQLRAQVQNVGWLKDIPEFKAAGLESGTIHDERHTQTSNFLFIDSHAKSMKRGGTYKMDGSYSMWTISNTWKVMPY